MDWRAEQYINASSLIFVTTGRLMDWRAVQYANASSLIFVTTGRLTNLRAEQDENALTVTAVATESSTNPTFELFEYVPFPILVTVPVMRLEYSDQLDADLYSDTRESGTKMESRLRVSLKVFEF